MRTYAKNKKEAIEIAKQEIRKEAQITRLFKKHMLIKRINYFCCCGETEGIEIIYYPTNDLFFRSCVSICSHCSKYNQ
jgi:hypothetical protein